MVLAARRGKGGAELGVAERGGDREDPTDRVQAISTAEGLVRVWAARELVRKMPAPTTMPTTTADGCQTPSSRFGRTASAGSTSTIDAVTSTPPDAVLLGLL